MPVYVKIVNYDHSAKNKTLSNCGIIAFYTPLGVLGTYYYTYDRNNRRFCREYKVPLMIDFKGGWQD